MYKLTHITECFVLQSAKGRRPKADDIDAPSRLSLLSNAYYRDILGDYGAYFAIANRIDRVHKNAWIGFGSWRATARMVCICLCHHSLRLCLNIFNLLCGLIYWPNLCRHLYLGWLKMHCYMLYKRKGMATRSIFGFGWTRIQEILCNLIFGRFAML